MRRVLDTDQHVTPPKNLWLSRMPSKYRDVAPRVVELPDGTEAWSFEGGKDLHAFGLENVGSRDPMTLSWSTRYDELDPAFYEPKARIEAMNADGIDATLLFASVAGRCAVTDDDDLYRECFRAYNDGIWDWAQAGDPQRMFPAAIIPCRSLATAIDELQRVADMGFRHVLGVMSPSGAGRPTPVDDPFWALVEETGMVVSLHGGGVGGRFPGAPAPANLIVATPRNAPMEALVTDLVTTKNANLWWLVLTGVLERFPDLLVVLVQAGAGWLETCGELLDWNYRYAQWVPGNGFARLKDLPSDSIRRQVLATVESDQRHLELVAGADRGRMVLWASAYPTSMSSWPESRLAIDQWDELPGVVKADVARNNYARTYRLANAAARQPLTTAE